MKKAVFFLALIILMFSESGCDINDEFSDALLYGNGSTLSVTTQVVTDISSTSAIGGGNVTSDGLETVTARGLAFGTSSNPTIAGSTVSSGSGTGSFTANMTNLAPNTTYYVRAYATNSLGVVYGNNVTFATQSSSEFSCGDNFTFNYKGQQVTYGTISKGGLCWMDRNLGADPMPFVPADDATGYIDTRLYGDLFQWGRLDDGHQDRTSSTSSGPVNQDVPGHGEFITVESEPYDWRSPRNDELWKGEDGVNNPCPPGWRVPTLPELYAESLSWTEGYNSAGAYASSLKWPVGGLRFYQGSHSNVGSAGFLWSSTVSGPHAMSIFFSSANGGVSGGYRAFGYSVRCVRDF